MKIAPSKWLISVGQLAEILGVSAGKITATAENIGIAEFDAQLNQVGWFNGTNAARIIIALSKVDGQCDFPGHPVLLGEIERLQAEQAAAAKGMN